MIYKILTHNNFKPLGRMATSIYDIMSMISCESTRLFNGLSGKITSYWATQVFILSSSFSDHKYPISLWPKSIWLRVRPSVRTILKTIGRSQNSGWLSFFNNQESKTVKIKISFLC